MLVESGSQADRVGEIEAENRLPEPGVVRGLPQGAQRSDNRGPAQRGQCQLVGTLGVERKQDWTSRPRIQCQRLEVYNRSTL